MTATKNHDVQSVNIQASPEKVFDFISKPQNLSKWTAAFSQADDTSALMVTPNGELKIGLRTITDKNLGIIDWEMTMPDGIKGMAYSRVVAGPDGNTIFTFTLLAPPVPLEQLEGALAAQIETLAKELKNLQSILNNQ